MWYLCFSLLNCGFDFPLFTCFNSIFGFYLLFFEIAQTTLFFRIIGFAHTHNEHKCSMYHSNWSNPNGRKCFETGKSWETGENVRFHRDRIRTREKMGFIMGKMCNICGASQAIWCGYKKIGTTVKSVLLAMSPICALMLRYDGYFSCRSVQYFGVGSDWWENAVAK